MDIIEIPRGDSCTINLLFSGDSGPLNLSGYGVRFVAAQSYEATGYIANVFVTEHDSYVSGVSHINITSQESDHCAGDYIYNFKLIDLSTSGTSSFEEGVFRILPNL